MINKLFKRTILLFLFLLSGCNLPTQFGTLPYDDSKPYPSVPVYAGNDIVSFMKKRGYHLGDFKALPLARIIKYRERYLGGPRDITYIGWFTSIKTKDNNIFYLYWDNEQVYQLKNTADVLQYYFVDDSESNYIINRKKEANIINKWYWINWRQ